MPLVELNDGKWGGRGVEEEPNLTTARTLTDRRGEGGGGGGAKSYDDENAY